MEDEPQSDARETEMAGTRAWSTSVMLAAVPMSSDSDLFTSFPGMNVNSVDPAGPPLEDPSQTSRRMLQRVARAAA